jgi:1,2-diacylglycerol 3-alpha-glucosyltransferase
LFSTDSTAREAPLARLTEAFRDTSLAIGATRKFRAAVLFDNIGPYHRARLEALADTCELLAVELGRTSHDYSWSAVESQRFGRVTINPLGESSKLAGAVLRERLGRSLRQFKPDVVFVPGWSCRGAIFAIHWCVRNRKRVVVMSESTRLEARRTPASEFIKERLLALAAASLAGGTPQKDYLINLGMKPERVALGYDAVDNRHFEAGAESVRRSESDEFEANPDSLSKIRRQHQLPRHYFLASARFIEKKNLPRLIEAYARYKSLAQSSVQASAHKVWDLVLLGDGPLRPALRLRLSSLGLSDCVQLPGFQQYNQLPVFYGLAEAFVHTSTTEQWGLVVNEAMASGLPVIVSKRCGCSPDLVQDGCNGFVFDPYDPERLARLMLRVSAMETHERRRMGDASREIIANWGPERFAQGLREAMKCAMSAAPGRATLLDRLLLRLLWFR